MDKSLIPPQVNDILRALLQLHPLPQSVWLFGSRANARVTPQSDTDLLVFADRKYVESLRRTIPSKPCDVDVLVVVDGDTIVYPWRHETGSLRTWEWKFTGTNSASYVGTKCRPDVDLDEDDLDAIRRISEAESYSNNFVNLCRVQIVNERAIRIFQVDA